MSTVVYILGLTGDPGAETAGDVLHYVFSLIPSYTVSASFRHYIQVRGGMAERILLSSSIKISHMVY